MKAQLETLTATSVLRFHLERQGLDQLQEIALQERPVSRTPATFHRVSSFVEVPGEEVMERTVSLLASLAGQGDAVVFWIHGDGHRYRLLYAEHCKPTTPAASFVLSTTSTQRPC